MKFCFLLTSEDPLRTSYGPPGGHWVSMSEIGKCFNGKVLTMSEYLRVETPYIQAVVSMLGGEDMGAFSVSWFEDRERRKKADPAGERVIAQIARKVATGERVEAACFPEFLKVVLRGYTWCQFDWDNGSRVRFCGDYTTAVGCPLANQDYSILSDYGDIAYDCPPGVRVRLGVASIYLEDIVDE